MRIVDIPDRAPFGAQWGIRKHGPARARVTWHDVANADGVLGLYHGDSLVGNHDDEVTAWTSLTEGQGAMTRTFNNSAFIDDSALGVRALRLHGVSVSGSQSTLAFMRLPGGAVWPTNVDVVMAFSISLSHTILLRRANGSLSDGLRWSVRGTPDSLDVLTGNTVNASLENLEVPVEQFMVLRYRFRAPSDVTAWVDDESEGVTDGNNWHTFGTGTAGIFNRASPSGNPRMWCRLFLYGENLSDELIATTIDML